MTVATHMIGDYYKGVISDKWIGIQIASISVSAILDESFGSSDCVPVILA